MIYSKKYPSKKYLQNINYYKEMHQNGFQRLDKFIDKENAYDGMSTKPFVNIIKKIIDINDCKSLLDYGCGKAKYYYKGFKTNKSTYPCLRDYLNVKINLYDPCYKKYDNLTNNKVDITICIDVLEHIPSSDIQWILKDFFSLTKKIIFISVACYEASAILPNGQNAHINIQTYDWWKSQLIKCAKTFEGIKIIAFCNFVAENGKMVHRCIEINDTFKKYS